MCLPQYNHDKTIDGSVNDHDRRWCKCQYYYFDGVTVNTKNGGVTGNAIHGVTDNATYIDGTVDKKW